MNEAGFDDGPNGWLLEPASNLVLFLGNEIVISGLTKKAILFINNSPWLFGVVGPLIPPDKKEGAAAMERLLMGSEADAAFAAKEISSGFATISVHHSISVWAAIETTIERILINHIRKLKQSGEMILQSLPELSQSKIKTVTEKDAKATLRAWEGLLPQKSAIARAISMLAVFKLNLILDEGVAQNLSELSELRNVLLHKGGRVDQRFLDRCPWVDKKVGDQINITNDKVDGYFDASTKFAISLIGAVAKSPFFLTVLRDQPNLD